MTVYSTNQLAKHMGTVKPIDSARPFGRSSTRRIEAEPKSRERFEIATAILERVCDLSAVMAASTLAYVAYELLHMGRRIHYSAISIVLVASGFSVLFVLLLDNDGAYRHANSLLRIRETERVLRVTMQALGIAFPVTFFFLHPFSRYVVFLAAGFVPILVTVEKQLVFLLIRDLHSRGYGLRNVLVYGAGLTGRRVYSAIVRSPKLGMSPIAFVDDDERLAGDEVYEFGYKRERSAQVITGPLNRGLIRELGVRLVIVGIPSISQQRLKQIKAEAFAAGADFAFVPQLSLSAESYTDYVDIDGVLVASMGLSERKRVYESVKQVFDFSAAIVLLFILLPLWVVLTGLIRLDSKGPALFEQMRIGRGGKPFKLYKFRTMTLATPTYGLHPSNADDPRITRVGRWLRRTSLDELPQLINVLKGDMSLVGPRPEMPFIVERYNDYHRQRLQVTPGLTGLWQLSADRAFLIHENIQYDLYYIRNRNFFMDLAILLHTSIFAMKGI